MKNNESDFITIGQVLAPWGIRGKIKVSILTDFPERFDPGETIYIDGKSMTIESTEWHKGNALVKVGGIETLDAAEELTGRYVEISPTQSRPLPEGEYYHYQIVGLRVVTTEGKELGTVTGILTSTANDIYVVKGKEGEILIPAMADVVRSIDLDKMVMVIEAIPGLLELNKKTGGVIHTR
jgi:16S rRNA processing protein RimM